MIPLVSGVRSGVASQKLFNEPIQLLVVAGQSATQYVGLLAFGDSHN